MARTPGQLGSLTFFTAAVLAASHLAAATEPGSAPPESAPHTELALEAPLEQLLELAAGRFGVLIEAEPGWVQGSVRLLGDGSLTDDELWLLVQRTLVGRRLTTVLPEGEDTFLVTRLESAAEASRLWPSPAPRQRRSAGEGTAPRIETCCAASELMRLLHRVPRG